MTTSRIVENYTNGNLKDAKRGARDVSHKSIRLAFQQAGFGLLGACGAADYLKGLGSFQSACDSEQLDKESFARIAAQEAR